MSDHIQLLMAEADEWVGTPYHHQASVKGVGADCIGLIAGIFSGVGLPFEYPANYSRGPAQEVMYDAIRKAGCSIDVPLAAISAGDVMVVRVRAAPQHFLMYLGSGKLIHADHSHGTCYDDIERWQSRIIRVLRHKEFT